MFGGKRKIRIAVAGGKGGGGKTTVATNLALVLVQSGEDVTYVDCDVEEPNGHLFLKPNIEQKTPVRMSAPVVDGQKCIGCGICAEICQYGAMVCLADRVLTFPELCHGCGGCALGCPVQAIAEIHLQIGVVEKGRAGPMQFVQGRLQVGRPSAVPVIERVRHGLPEWGIQIVDCPPGTSCPAVQSVRGVDFVLAVTEATPFGLNDLVLTVEMLRILALPFGVLINRVRTGLDGVRKYCAQEHIDVLSEIPEDRRVAEAYSRDEMASVALPEYHKRFFALSRAIESCVVQ